MNETEDLLNGAGYVFCGESGLTGYLAIERDRNRKSLVSMSKTLPRWLWIILFYFYLDVEGIEDSLLDGSDVGVEDVEMQVF